MQRRKMIDMYNLKTAKKREGLLQISLMIKTVEGSKSYEITLEMIICTIIGFLRSTLLFFLGTLVI